MLIFALDTSGPTAGVALLRDGLLVYESVVRNGRTHSESLMPMAQEAYERAGFKVGDTDCFAAVTGPGSFTGVRIGVTAVKAMAHAADRPCVEVRALEAMARGAMTGDGLVCPMQDARAGQVYAALFCGRERLMQDAALPLPACLDQVFDLAAGRPVLFTGDGMLVHRDEIARRYAGQAAFAPPEAAYLRPAAAAAIAWERVSQAVPESDLHPFYLRPPRAEKQKNLVNAYE